MIQTDRIINLIRGKNSVGEAIKDDVDILFEHIDALEMFLNERERDDIFGTEGWRHAIGMPD